MLPLLCLLGVAAEPEVTSELISAAAAGRDPTGTARDYAHLLPERREDGLHRQAEHDAVKFSV